MPESCPSRTTRGRRESRELAAPMAPVRKECTGKEPQVRPRHPGLPCTMALQIIRGLPGAPGLLVTIICAKRGFDAHLIPASGYQDIHDFSVRNGARSS